MDAKTDRLREVLATYGADPQHWPAVERGTLLSSMAEAPDLAAEAAEIDLVLGRAAPVAIPPGLACAHQGGERRLDAGGSRIHSLG